jgi:hypothetical protein
MLVDKYIESTSFLTKKEIEEYRSCVYSSSFPWYLCLKTNPGYEYDDDDTMLNHVAYSGNFPNSDYCNLFINLFDRFCEEQKIQYVSILRIRLNLFFSREKIF